jgi:hypothetical protein
VKGDLLRAVSQKNPSNEEIKTVNNNQYKSSTYWLFIVCGLFIFYFIDSMWSGSVDLAHHYALAYRISEQWVLISSNDPTLGEMNGEMNVYPRGSHIVAAIVGRFVDSTFLGMQITTLLSLAVLWLSVILVLNSLRGVLASLSIIIFTALIFLNFLFTKFDIHGHEIVGNFFFAQMVGHSMLFLGILFSIYLEKTRGVLWSVALLTVLMLINATIHLMPALQILGVVFGLLFTYIFFNSEFQNTTRHRFFIAVIMAMLGILCMIIHPSFTTMASISKHNGYLILHNISYPYGLIFLCLLVLFVSIKLYWGWIHSRNYKENLAIKYIAIYGGATVALCLLSLVLIFFGYGSDYAVKKYSFGLVSILFLEVSIVLAEYIYRVADKSKIWFITEDSSLNKYILVASLFLVLFCIVPSWKSIDVSDVVSIERKLINIADTLLPLPETGKSNVAIGLHGSPTINYMFSVAILKTVRELAIPDVLIKNQLSALSKYSYIVSSQADPRYNPDGCNSFSKSSLSIIASECLEQRQALASDSRLIDFRESNFPVYVKEVQGISNHEYWGAWTNGDQAIIKYSEPLPLRFTLLVTGGAWAENVNRPIGFRVGSVQREAIFEGDPFNKPTTVSLDFELNENVDTLKINIPFPISDIDSDSRSIGVGLTTLRIEERK